MNLFIFTLSLCILFIYSCNATYFAVFLTGDTTNLLKNKFFRPHPQSSPFFGNTAHIYSEHSTIEFNPKSDFVKQLTEHYGHIQKLAVLAYAEDEHAQTVLVRYIGNDDIHLSDNEYPHITISVSNMKPYTPVYSNDLWKRLVDDGIIKVQKDNNDKPQAIALKDQTDEWQGRLSSAGKYEETQAYVRIMNQTTELNGIVYAKYLLKNMFFRPHPQSSAFFGNTAHIYCEHSTIEFNPKRGPIEEIRKYYGYTQKLAVLAYAEDEHAQTILVRGIGHSGIHASYNKYPHITISISNVKPYTPVYSNDLWKRLVHDGIVKVHKSKNGKPRSVTIKNRTDEWQGKLSSYGQYEETEARVETIDERIELNGIVCVDNLWRNGRCHTAK
ncbi:unnamed protein product [Adineta ricciae]|uniref:Uncharacterized protein n=1 Tax=Adineta ricciae TaxID=249248 RepID=A0A814WUX2_ADIRI|nr:unnamed protein product [Adineta ricciae]CAF1400200.1 unnamed protein product [Adineta ricciae]